MRIRVFGVSGLVGVLALLISEQQSVQAIKLQSEISEIIDTLSEQEEMTAVA